MSIMAQGISLVVTVAITYSLNLRWYCGNGEMITSVILGTPSLRSSRTSIACIVCGHIIHIMLLLPLSV